MRSGFPDAVAREPELTTEARERDRPAEPDRQEPGSDKDGGTESLSWGQRRYLIALGVPTFGLSVAATVVSTYLPVFIQSLSGPLLTGVMLGGEGLFGLFLPLIVGSRSDRVRTRLGSRMPFVLAATPVAVVALILMPLVGSILAVGVLLACFYIAYFTYYAPYRALYPDVVREEHRSRSQGIQKTWREAGLGLALVSGGLLLSAWKPLPFMIAALVLAASTLAFYRWIDDPGEGSSDEEQESVAQIFREVIKVVRHHPAMRWLITANALWEGTLAALKVFVVLYITVGLGKSPSLASAVLAIVALAVVIAALAGGTWADKVGNVPLMRRAAWVYACGLAIPIFFDSSWLVAIVPPTAFAAGIVMALPYAAFMNVLEEEEHGISSGIFEFSRAMGTLAGPILAGVAVTVLKPVFPSTQGYAAVFLVASVLVFASIFALRRMQMVRDRVKKEREGAGAVAGRADA
jgi:Na+/melibiose symporter-like transporter